MSATVAGLGDAIEAEMRVTGRVEVSAAVVFDAFGSFRFGSFRENLEACADRRGWIISYDRRSVPDLITFTRKERP